MIKNIVFDMGNVLVHYDADRVCRQFIEDPEDRKAVSTAVFVSPEWILLDMGVISESEALKRMTKRLPEERLKKYAGECLAHWHEYNMWPVEGMKELIKLLKEKGYGIYLCSNASLRLLTCYKEVIPGIEYFDGVLFSADVKYLKPQADIYRTLFERFDLKPEECFFIDDIQDNIDGAKACGMDGYCFEDGDLGRLKEEFRKRLS